MKKIIIIFLTLISVQFSAFAEVITPRGVLMTKETHPIFWSYLENYSSALKQKLEASHMFRLRGFGASYVFFITKDGEIKDMKISTYQNKYYNEKVKEIILSVKPEPFYKGMDCDEMLMSVYLGYEKYNDIEISIGWDIGTDKKQISVTVITDK